MVSEVDLMAGATDLMSLGLAKTHDQAVRLTTVVGQLGMDMNQLTLTLSNRTTMRFDSLNVAVDGFDEKLKGLEATGMDTNDAFTEAFLQQAEEQVLKVGDAADSAVGSYKRWTAATSDLKDMTKQLANDGFEPLIASAAEWLAQGNSVRAATLALNDAVEAGFITAKQRRQINRETRGDDAAWIAAAAEITRKYDEHIARMKTLNTQTDAQGYAYGLYVGAIKNVSAAETEATGVYLEAFKERRQAMSDFNEFRVGEVQRWSSIESSYLEASKQNSQDLADVQDELALKRSQQYWEQGSTIQGLLAKEGELITKQQEIEDAHDKATKAIILGYIEQKFMADGILTNDETEWLLAKGVE